MLDLLPVLLILLILSMVIMPFIALAAAHNAKITAREAKKRIEELEAEIRSLQRTDTQEDHTPPVRTNLPEKKSLHPTVDTDKPVAKEEPDLPRLEPEPLPETLPAPLPPPLPQSEPAEATAATQAELLKPQTAAKTIVRPAISIEQFLGVKLFAWLGGMALFFGIIFFVRYAFEHDLIPPAARVGLGLMTGLTLLVGGWLTNRRANYRVLAHALCATGVVTLYGVSFAGHAVYQLPLFSGTLTFLLLTAVTVAAFVTAVRNNALVIAVIGMLAGFITPILLPMVQDHPSALFGYTALLDIGLLALVVRGRWSFLSGGAALSTILMFSIWTSRFFLPGGYSIGTATLVPMGILTGFMLLFLAASWRTSRNGGSEMVVPVSSFAITLTSFVFSCIFLAFESIAERGPLLYGFVLLINLSAVSLSLFQRRFSFIWILSATATFFHIAVWLSEYLTHENLFTGLLIILVFGTLYTLLPTITNRLGGNTSTPIGGLSVTPWIPTILIGLMAMGLLVLDDVAIIFWPAILVANLLGFVACARSRMALPVVTAMGITVLTATIWMFLMPEVSAAINQLLGILIGFALFFAGSGFWLAGRLVRQGPPAVRDPRVVLPVCAAAMPFFLLNLTTINLDLPNPSSVFAAASFLIAMLCGTAIWRRQPRFLAIAFALGCSTLFIWHGNQFATKSTWPALGWYLGYYVVFVLLPFAFRRICDSSRAPWVISSLTGPVLFLLIHHAVSQTYPSEWMGWVPAAFVIPSLGLMIWESQFNGPVKEPGRTRLAWFGGTALFFITLIFPIQFDHQWLTLGWALEGAALIWLFRHVPHPGLLATGFALLTIGFVRLSINPATFVEYERSGGAIFNWHLYVYGICALATLTGAFWFPPRMPKAFLHGGRGILFCFGGILLFLLMNIQIADFFTEPNSKFIAFEFSGNFARDMTYTISWALFALILLVAGILSTNRGTRYAAIGLLGTALLKLFLNDLANIESIFRIAALLCTGVIAFIASFLYQRFIPNLGEEKKSGRIS